ncbi:MAG: N-acetylmuramic acid 6-phosphate etherase [Defluviitaleaceae bacterium]|nr:N-acetylmuramic acid 6-phosphate etherase [Defluviitaleaceae bacterium]
MLENLTTEKRNPETMNMDQMSALEIVTIMNAQDALVPEGIKKALPEIAEAVSEISKCIMSGGRLIYCGAGTSGRLGVLDAAECVPTFSVSPDVVVGVIAGGIGAMVRSSEGTEDIEEQGRSDVADIKLCGKDFLVGIAASGRTPYVIGALKYAKEVGAKTCAVSTNANAVISKYADIAIEAVCGPEVLTGSTRLKSGTAQKLILNMLSTAGMVLSGKTYQNLMVDVSPTNVKLVNRAKRIIMDATGADENTAAAALEKSGNSPKVAIVMIAKECEREEAEKKLKENGGFVAKAIAKG